MKRTLSDARDEIIISYGEKVFPAEEVTQAKVRKEFIIRSENALKANKKDAEVKNDRSRVR